MKNIIYKNIVRFFLALMITVAGLLAAGTLKASPDPENYIYIRECGNGICLVYVYTQLGSLVNVYEELD